MLLLLRQTIYLYVMTNQIYLTTMTLLCIDDDPEDVELFCDAVKIINPDCTCVTAQNAADAFTTLRTLRPDYIFLDINMPGMNGVEAMQVLHDDDQLKDIPVCVLSTSMTDRDAKRYSSLGAQRTIRKPNRFAELCTALNFIND